MEATAIVANAAAYPNDDVSIAGGIVDNMTHEAKSVYLGRSAPAGLRVFNGDVCVIPAEETPIAHGWAGDTEGPAAWVNGTTKGRFGGHFLNDDIRRRTRTSEGEF